MFDSNGVHYFKWSYSWDTAIVSPGEVQPPDVLQYTNTPSYPGIIESYMGPTASAEVTEITDDFGSIQ
jgi:hypothetical protein